MLVMITNDPRLGPELVELISMLKKIVGSPKSQKVQSGEMFERSSGRVFMPKLN
jgi:hypothetical protein